MNRALCVLAALLSGACALAAQEPGPARAIEIDSGRFAFLAYSVDIALARSLLDHAVAHDTFPGLPRPRTRVRVLIMPDPERFRAAIGPAAPEWGAAVATPEDGRIVMQGSRAGSSAGDPRATLRHELAHLALHEAVGDLPPRWFDEGYASYAAGELARDDVLATNVALAFTGIPPLDSLDAYFTGGEARAQTGYALARAAVAEIAALDPVRGLSLLFPQWRETRSLDQALRRAYGVTEAGFEARWRASTRRRYGALALFADVTFAALLFLAVIAPFWVIRRRRDRARMAAMRAADELQDRREREDALHALLSGHSDPPPDDGTKPGNENLIN